MLGIYLTLCNLRNDLRQQNRNIECVGVLGPKRKFYEAIECHVEQLLKLQTGAKMYFAGKGYRWVQGGVGLLAADFPMGTVTCHSQCS